MMPIMRWASSRVAPTAVLTVAALFLAVGATGAAAAPLAPAASLSATRDGSNPLDWLAVEAVIESFKNLSDVAVTAGDPSGRKFKFTKGNTTMHSQMLLMSASKWPAAMAIAGAVADGHLTFDTKASAVFPWWTTSPSDRRSRVTLRHLLSFTSGFYWPDESGFVPCMEGNGSVFVHPEDCAKEVYEQAPFEFEPGTTWAYNSFHLQVAGAMAAKAAGTTVQGLLHDNLIGKLGLLGSGFLLGQNPVLAASMHTTPEDYDKILEAYLSYKLLPKEVCDRMELDYLSPPYATAVANSSTFDVGYIGHYSMCNWYECFNLTESTNPTSAWSPECKAAMVHQDLGLFGYYPIIDRKNQIYMQIGQMTVEGLNSTGQGVENSVVLRYFITDLVYKALGKPKPYLPPLPPGPPQHSAGLANRYELGAPRVPRWSGGAVSFFANLASAARGGDARESHESQ